MADPTPQQAITEALDLIAKSFAMDQKSSGNVGQTPRLMMERAKTLAFVSVAQTVAEMAAATSSTNRPAGDKVLGALLAVQTAATPPVATLAPPTPVVPASTPAAATPPTPTVPTAPTGVLLTTYAAAWADGYKAAYPSSWSAGFAAAWSAAFAAGYRAGHPAGHAVGVADEAANLLRLLTAALAA